MRRSRRLVGTDDPRWVRVEGEDEGGAAALGADAADLLDDLDVPAMQPIEIAEGEDWQMPARRTPGSSGKRATSTWTGSYQCTCTHAGA